jgi:hypothetical protein
MFKYLKSTYKSLKKIINKEVKKGERDMVNEPAPDRTLGDLRKRQKQVERSRLNQLEKAMEAKKAKKRCQHRHRSTPGEVLGCESAPSSPHKEGKRWIANTRKKINNNNKIYNKTSTKH